MDTAGEVERKDESRYWHNRKNRISFSASLPDDVSGMLTVRSICAVKFSVDPFTDLRESVIEMIQDLGIQDWEEMEELVYCYFTLNSPEIYHIIEAVFLSLCPHWRVDSVNIRQ